MVKIRNYRQLLIKPVLLLAIWICAITTPASVLAVPACGTADQCANAAIQCQTNGGVWDGTAGTCGSGADAQANASQSSGGKATIDIDGTSSEISGLIQSILNIIYGISGVSIIGVIILAGIQYSSSNGNPQAVSAAKKKIQNAVLALVVLAILYPFLQWIVPGGAFN